MSNYNTNLPDGVLTATVTPLTADYQIDHDALASHCHWLLANGNDGICLMGTTGEANSFSVEERMEALERVIEGGVPARKLLVGTGCCALTDTVRLTRHAISKQAGGVLMLPPFYYKQVTEDGLSLYFDKVVHDVASPDLRIYLYHMPKVTGVPFTWPLIQRLVAAHPGVVVGMKDSSGEWANMKAVCEMLPGFKVYAGTEKYLLDILKAGGAGSISATTNLTGKLAAGVYTNKDTAQASQLQAELGQVRSAFEGFSFVAAVKHMLAKSHENQQWLNIRPPNSCLGKEDAAELEGRLARLGFLLS